MIKHKHNIQFCDGKHPKQIIYNKQYDAYFCPECKEWTEPKCNDSDCEWCSNRPEKVPGMVRVKYNDGQGAILCSSCSIIIKRGNEFTDLENEHLSGIIDYLPEYFCEECKMTSKFEFIFSILLTIFFSLGLLVFLVEGMWITFSCFSIATALTIKYCLFKEK